MKKAAAIRKQQARKSNPEQANIITHFFRNHLQAATMALGRIYKSPYASLFTMLVMGIALSLPAGLFALLQNINVIAEHYQQGSQITVFLHTDTSLQQISSLTKKINRHHDIAKVDYISPQKGLSRFKKQSGFGEVLDQLPNNPLPPVLKIYPKSSIQSAGKIKQLIKYLQSLPKVEIVQMDLEWLTRLYSIVHLGKRVIYMMACFFCLAVILVVGNTIRLATINRRREIEVIKLIGGANSFIRRPFLYTGVYYGFLASIIAWILVGIFFLSIMSPVRELSGLYQSQFHLSTLGPLASLNLLMLGALLGLVGSWLAVYQQMRLLDP